MTKVFKIKIYINAIIKWYVNVLKYNLGSIRLPIHIIFCICDHCEPGTGNASEETEKKRVNELIEEFPKIARFHKDSDKRNPKISLFFPPHYHRYGNLKKITSMCEKGFGEIELHLHHGKIKPDTSENLRNTILQTVEEYSKFGIFGKINGIIKYGFIHGDWALDNSRNGRFCGVNDEINVLINTGCYADFTQPALNSSLPSQINSIFYAIDNPQKPKSFDKGIPVEYKKINKNDLMIIQGPLFPYFFSNRIGRIRIKNDSIDGFPEIDHKIIKNWVDTNITISGCKNIIFIKTHSHGSALGYKNLSKELDNAYRIFESKYNDGKKYILHYVTAREMFNIIKAIEYDVGKKNIENLRDYFIKKPRYISTVEIQEASEMLKLLVSKTY